jgi:ABC-type amino acid transport substrate-binding protein
MVHPVASKNAANELERAHVPAALCSVWTGSSPARRLLRCGLLLAIAADSWATEPADSEAVQLVGLLAAPPFAMEDSEGNWKGIAIDVWRHVAHGSGAAFRVP